MTLNQLKEAVARLGFETQIEDNVGFVIAANRALAMIYGDRPVTRTVRVSNVAPRVLGKVDALTHTAGEKEELPLEGIAYSFRATGAGRYTVIDGTEKRYGAFDGDSVVIRGRLKSGGSILFEGDHPYTVYGLASFDGVYYPSDDRIPEYGLYRDIDVKERYGDLLAFCSVPTDKDGKEVGSAVLHDGVISVPFELGGELTVTYRRAPREIVNDDPEALIDVPQETAELLPLLTASFLWLDDDPDKAQFYLALYRDGMSGLKRSASQSIGGRYRTNGWA